MRRICTPLSRGLFRRSSGSTDASAATLATGPAAGRRLLRRSAAGAATTLALTAGALSTAGPAAADNPVTPGDFTGYGFDQCLAPTQSQMNAWLKHSPFLAAGIYISGDSRGCRSQPNLTPDWIQTQLAKGWRLLPITLGPQASCSPHFPRYQDDVVINDARGKGRYEKARDQGRREARKTVGVAKDLGITPGSTLWYDLEAFDIGKTDCRESALRFVHAWTSTLHRLGYVSGMYSSAASGIKMLDDVRLNRPGAYKLPDRIWIARWDGKANTETGYIAPDGWLPGNRMKQYRGGHHETWGGVTINIDSNWLDLGSSKAPAEEHCGGTRVNFKSYPGLSQGGDNMVSRVKALQCLLHERGHYQGKVDGDYDKAVAAAVRAFQDDRGLSETGSVGTRDWVALHAQGNRAVVKRGSTGSAVRRAQRALNSAGDHRLVVDGVFGAGTDDAVRSYQRAVGIPVSGVVNPRTWNKMRQGRS